MGTTTRRFARTAVALGLSAAFVATATPAEAKGLEIRRSGTCSGSATWTLKAKADNGRIEVELEVDSNVSGQAWAVALRDQGVLVHSGVSRTVAPSGSFEVRRIILNRVGTDTISAVANHPATGQRCAGSLSFPG